jgi:hypothetical protein
MLADEPDMGTGSDPRAALREALKALGEPLAGDLARRAARVGARTPDSAQTGVEARHKGCPGLRCGGSLNPLAIP